MMGTEDARYMKSFMTEQIWIISASGWLFNKKSITMHGNINIKCVYLFTSTPITAITP